MCNSHQWIHRDLETHHIYYHNGMDDNMNHSIYLAYIWHILVIYIYIHQLYPYETWPWHISGIYLGRDGRGWNFGALLLILWWFQGIFSENRDKDWFKMFSDCVFDNFCGRCLPVAFLHSLSCYTVIYYNLQIETLLCIILNKAFFTVLVLVCIPIWNLSAKNNIESSIHPPPNSDSNCRLATAEVKKRAKRRERSLITVGYVLIL